MELAVGPALAFETVSDQAREQRSGDVPGAARSTCMLSNEQCRFFRMAGYLPVGQVSAQHEVATLKAEASRLLGTAEGSAPAAAEDHLMRATTDGGHVRVALHLCHISDAYRTQALHARVTSMLHRILGEDPVVLTSLLFNKPPKVGEALGLHQDLPYYPYLGNDDLVTCWMALDDADASNGCLEYLPGSHLTGIAHRHTGMQQALDIDPADVDVARLVQVPLKSGEGVLHHGLTVHRSAANHSGRPRMGLATLYARASAQVSVDDFPYAVLVPPLSARR